MAIQESPYDIVGYCGKCPIITTTELTHQLSLCVPCPVIVLRHVFVDYSGDDPNWDNPNWFGCRVYFPSRKRIVQIPECVRAPPLILTNDDYICLLTSAPRRSSDPSQGDQEIEALVRKTNETFTSIPIDHSIRNYSECWWMRKFLQLCDPWKMPRAMILAANHRDKETSTSPWSSLPPLVLHAIAPYLA